MVMFRLMTLSLKVTSLFIGLIIGVGLTSFLGFASVSVGGFPPQQVSPYPSPYPQAQPTVQAFPVGPQPGVGVGAHSTISYQYDPVRQSYVPVIQGMPGGGAQGLPAAQGTPPKEKFKNIEETYPKNTQGWSMTTTEDINLKGKKITLLAPERNHSGPVNLKKTYDLSNAAGSELDIHMEVWALRSWDGEQIKIMLNGKEVFTYASQIFSNSMEKAGGDAKKDNIENTCVPVMDEELVDTNPAKWGSEKLKCHFKVKVEKNKITFKGEEIPNPAQKDKPMLEVSIEGQLNEPAFNESLGLETLKITGSGSSMAGGDDLNLPPPIQILVITKPLNPFTLGPRQPMPPVPPTSQQPSAPAAPPLQQGRQFFPPQQIQSYDPSLYYPHDIDDRTAGFMTDGALREGSGPCAQCLSPNKDISNSEICQKCVALSRETVRRSIEINKQKDKRIKDLEEELRKLKSSNNTISQK